MRYSLIVIGILSLIAWAAGLFPGSDSAPSFLLDLGPNSQQRAAAAAIDSLAKDFWSKNGPVQIVEEKKDTFKKWALEDGSPWSVVEAYEMWLGRERRVDREAGPGGWMVGRDPRGLSRLAAGATKVPGWWEEGAGLWPGMDVSYYVRAARTYDETGRLPVRCEPYEVVYDGSTSEVRRCVLRDRAEVMEWGKEKTLVRVFGDPPKFCVYEDLCPEDSYVLVDTDDLERKIQESRRWRREYRNNRTKADTIEFSLPGGATLKSISRQAEDAYTRIDSIWVIHKYADGSEWKQGYSAEELEVK